MNHLLPTFKIVSVIFASSALVTGAQAIVDPVGFARGFGLPLITATEVDKSQSTLLSHSYPSNGNPTTSYVSLMGVRQLATGLTLFTFAYQGKWTEMATILSILGIVVAGTDGFYLSRSGDRNRGIFHALPGALISLLAGATILADA